MTNPETTPKKKALTPAAERKLKQKVHIYIRFAVQVGFFIAFPSAYSAAFAGVKYIFSQMGAHQLLEVTPFVAILIALCVYTIIFGRFFCGYACAYGSLGDWIFGIHKTICNRRMKQPVRIPDKVMEWLALVKFAVLALIIILCVKELFSKTMGMSPWDAFAQLRAGQVSALDTYVIGLVIQGLIMIGMFFSERFFCRVLCPMGAVFALMPVLPIFSMHRDRSSCIPGCSGCTKVCPANIELPDRKKFDVSGDCFQCHKCVGVCPRSNVSCKIRRIRGNETVFILVRVAILVILFWKLGV